MDGLRFLLFLGGLSLVGGGVACSHPAQAHDEAPPQPIPLTVTRVKARAAKVPRTLTYQATVLAARDTVISAVAGGRLEVLLAERGDKVHKGDALARFRDAEARAAAEGAVANVAGAEARLAGDRDPERSPEVVAAEEAVRVAADARRRAETLSSQGSVSDQDLLRMRSGEETARAQRDAALAQARAAKALVVQSRAALRQSRAALADFTLRAPYDGVVLERLVETGEVLAAGAPVLRVVDPSSLRVRFEVGQHEAASIALGQQVELDGGRAQISRLAPGLTGESRTRTVEARVDPAPSSLLPGSRIPVRVLLDASDDVVIVPRNAVRNEGGVARIWVVRDGRASERLPEVLRMAGDEVLVRRGLADGEDVVPDAPRELRDGMQVTP
ncbi:efflux RND transporter periplasmic adaptor subunit [Pendulispora rubella]|uniref:Efflux RND transporter periplasmic adaptor subunit n=1 Tax=Pendulispora rubella TaxID=2741070 RepID=A0ABZ2LF08_9BACT